MNRDPSFGQTDGDSRLTDRGSSDFGFGEGKEEESPDDRGAVRRLSSELDRFTGDFSLAKDDTMQANVPNRRFLRNGCSSTHFLLRRDLADHCEPRPVYPARRGPGTSTYCRSIGHGFAHDFDSAGPGHGTPEWDF